MSIENPSRLYQSIETLQAKVDPSSKIGGEDSNLPNPSPGPRRGSSILMPLFRSGWLLPDTL